MDLKSTLRNAGVAAAACAFAGMAAAAVVPIEQSLDLHLPQGSLVYNIATEGAPPDNSVSFYELVVQPSWTQPTRFTTFSAEPVGTTAAYELYVDTDAAIEAGNTGTKLSSWLLADVPGNNLIPFHEVLLSAGQYILEIRTRQDQYSISTQISAIPLPGALWLFGSAVLAFMGISLRRRI